MAALNESIAMLENSLYFASLNEEAKFSFLPKFKTLNDKYPELEKAKGLIDETDQILGMYGQKQAKQNHNVVLRKIYSLINRIYKYISSAGSVLLLPACLFIIGIPAYLLQRLVVWEADYIVEKNDEEMLREAIKNAKLALDKVDNAEAKKKIQAQIDKMEATRTEM